MSEEWTIFVEGPSDCELIGALITRLAPPATPRIEEIDGGATALGEVANVIQRERDLGHRVALVLDADTSLASTREIVKGKGVVVDKTFFLPNDCDSGCLEHLLEEMALPHFLPVHACFESYKTCLKSIDCSTPDFKSKIYAYCEAVGTKPQVGHRKYDDRRFWDLDADALKPLETFLRSLVGPQ